jgi:hypothetical protein
MRVKIKATKAAGVDLFTSLRFQRIQRPKFADSLKFPEDITELSPASVSDMLGKYTQMYAYANQELSLLNVALLGLQTQEARRTTEMFKANPSLNHQERWRRDCVVDTDPQIMNIQMEISLTKQSREVVQMFLNNYDRYLTALSRELSRKAHDNDLSRRNA